MRALLLMMSLLIAAPARAGHGMLNAFAGIEWLPAAGTTPDAPYYALDTWDESLRLKLAKTSDAVIDLALHDAREKLAELEAMIRARKEVAARVAIDRYRALIEAASAQMNDASPPTIAKFATALLEHQYIVSTDYMDLPRDARLIIKEVVATASAHYAEVSHRLPRPAKDALVFKEEEVRWSWDMARAADEQGL